LNYRSFGSPPAILVITFDTDKVIQSIANLSWADKGTIFITNSENDYIHYGEIDILPDALSHTEVEYTKPIFDEIIDDQEMILINVDSDISDFRYWAVIPSQIYLERVKYIKSIIGMYAIIYIVVGCALAYLLTRRNYTPLNQLVQKAISILGDSRNEGGHEFDFLENSLRKLLNEKESMNHRLKQQHESMRNNYIIRLLKGRIKNPNSDGDIYGIKLDGQYYASMIFKIQDIRNLFFENNIEENEETINLAYFIVKNIAEEITRQNHDCYIAETDGMVVSLINIKAQKDFDVGHIDEEMMNIAKKAKQFIEEKFGIKLSVSISNVHSELENIPTTYMEAMECIEYITFFDEQSIIVSYNSIENSHQENFLDNLDNLNLERERLLINCICAADYKKALEIINDVFQNEFTEKKHPIQLIKYWVFGLIGLVVKALGDIDNGNDEKILRNNDLIGKLLDAKSVKEIQININKIFLKLHQYYSQNKEVEPAWLDEVVSYIDNNFYDPNINVECVANQVNITPSYLSQTFKKYKRISVLEYIHSLRIEKAKLLLKEGYTIKESAEKVGYTNSLALNRAFKRYVGITPGRYRESELIKIKNFDAHIKK